MKREPAEKAVVEAPKLQNIPTSIVVESVPEPSPVIDSQVNKVVEQKFQEEKKTENPSSSKIQKTLPDLSKFMGINDKFLFSNQLFNGNMQDLNSAVQMFNGIDNLESAMVLVESLRDKYNWEVQLGYGERSSTGTSEID
jgi:hypothetical protein